MHDVVHAAHLGRRASIATLRSQPLNVLRPLPAAACTALP